MRVRSTSALVGSVVVVIGLLLLGSARPNTDGARVGSPSAAVPDFAAVGTASTQDADDEDKEAGPRPPPPVVTLASASFGQKMTDGKGATLYVSSADAPRKSNCTAACSGMWLPMRSLGGKPQPGAGVDASRIGDIQRPDGSDQVTLDGHPLYYYNGDARTGDSKGHQKSAFGGHWSAAPPAASSELKETK